MDANKLNLENATFDEIVAERGDSAVGRMNIGDCYYMDGSEEDYCVGRLFILTKINKNRTITIDCVLSVLDRGDAERCFFDKAEHVIPMWPQDTPLIATKNQELLLRKYAISSPSTLYILKK